MTKIRAAAENKSTGERPSPIDLGNLVYVLIAVIVMLICFCIIWMLICLLCYLKCFFFSKIILRYYIVLDSYYYPLLMFFIVVIKLWNVDSLRAIYLVLISFFIIIKQPVSKSF